MTLFYILLSTVLMGLVSMVGILAVVAKMDTQKIAFYLVSLASGTMLGGALLHLLPESLEASGTGVLPLVGAGMFFFFILEKFLVWRHCHTHEHEGTSHRVTSANMVLAGDAIHNFIDGMIIASSYMAGLPVGMAVTAAILLHEIPQELGDFGVLVRGGYSTRKALLANVATGVMSILGALLTYFFIEWVPALQPFLLPFTAGGFLYIALADLIPQLHEHTAVRATISQISLLIFGFLLTFLLRHAH